MSGLVLENGVKISATLTPSFAEILNPGAVEFVSLLERAFRGRRRELLALRRRKQEEIDSGILPRFPLETEGIRKGNWTVGEIPNDLLDRRVEITGPAGDTKMVINALNSGANVYMADFEDSQSPTWHATMQGQVNLRDAINRRIGYTSPEGKIYKLNEKTAVLMVRPRGWHLEEKHVLIDGEPISASIFDFGLFFFNNARNLIEKGTGPYFYLPKLENRFEARLWNDVFSKSESEIGLPNGTIKATVLIENILAAFEMDEILYELRNYVTGLNCGRWDYIFSFIKKFKNYPELVLPDRAVITMDRGFLASYVSLLVKTCHRRKAHAMGGMAAQIPIKNDQEANLKALQKVREDKEREVRAGHDGTWVAHPGLVEIAKQVFDEGLQGPNQIHNLREDVQVTERDLLAKPQGEITEEGLRLNISVGLQYLEAWLRGKGSVPINNLMEDSATAEICRAQIWQWIKHRASTSTGKIIDVKMFKEMLSQEVERIKKALGVEAFSKSKFKLASQLFEDMSTAKDFPEFLTIVCYPDLLRLEYEESRRTSGISSEE